MRRSWESRTGQEGFQDPLASIFAFSEASMQCTEPLKGGRTRATAMRAVADRAGGAAAGAGKAPSRAAEADAAGEER